MSKYSFSDGLYKSANDISNTLKHLNLFNKSFATQNVGGVNYNLNEIYINYQKDSNSLISLNLNIKTLEYLIKGASDDLSDKKSLDSLNFINQPLNDLSISRITLANHTERIMTLSSISRLQKEIENKKEVLKNLKRDGNNDEANDARVSQTKVSFLANELDIIKENASKVKKRTGLMINSAKSLKSSIHLFNESEKLISSLKSSIKRDSDLISKQTDVCRQKIGDVNNQISAVLGLSTSIKDMFESSLANTERINLALHEKLSSEDIQLDHLGSRFGNSKMYYLLICLLDGYVKKCQLSPIRDEIKSMNFDYKEESKSVSVFYGKTQNYQERLNEMASDITKSTSEVEQEVWQIVSKIENVFNDWLALKDIGHE